MHSYASITSYHHIIIIIIIWYTGLHKFLVLFLLLRNHHTIYFYRLPYKGTLLFTSKREYLYGQLYVGPYFTCNHTQFTFKANKKWLIVIVINHLVCVTFTLIKWFKFIYLFALTILDFFLFKNNYFLMDFMDLLVGDVLYLCNKQACQIFLL